MPSPFPLHQYSFLHSYFVSHAGQGGIAFIPQLLLAAALYFLLLWYFYLQLKLLTSLQSFSHFSFSWCPKDSGEGQRSLSASHTQHLKGFRTPEGVVAVKAHSSAAAVHATLSAGELVGAELPACLRCTLTAGFRRSQIVCIWMEFYRQQGYGFMHLHEPNDFLVELRFCFMIGRFKHIVSEAFPEDGILHWPLLYALWRK